MKGKIQGRQGKYLRKQGGLLPRVAKGVDVPGHTGAPVVAKRVLKEAEAQSHLVYDGSVVRGRLVIHHPATVSKLQTPCARRGKIQAGGQGQECDWGWQCRG